MLLDRQKELVNKLYCEPKNEVIIWNFLTSVLNENIHLNQPQQQQLAQKKVNRKRKTNEEQPTSKIDIRNCFNKSGTSKSKEQKNKEKSKSAETCIVVLDQKKKTFIPLCIIVTIYLSYFQTRERIHYPMRHTLLFPFQYSMFTNNIGTISPFNDDVVCLLGFKANDFLLQVKVLSSLRALIRKYFTKYFHFAGINLREFHELHSHQQFSRELLFAKLLKTRKIREN